MPSRSAPAIRIGCAGWSIATRHAVLFDDGGSALARYATRLDVAEINSSFYRPHRPQTYERWAAQVPPHFRFSVKVPKAVTHEARLVRAGDALARFADEVAGLGRKLGGLLVQLPPSLAYEARVANTFFAVLRRRFPRTPVACEPRHPSWYEPRVDALWARHAVARVAADPPRPQDAAVPGGHGRWHYWRWHGSPRIYFSAYDDDRLRALAAALRAHARRGRPAWCIFDNTAHAHAIENALRLKALLREAPPERDDAAPRRSLSRLR
ncbi:MAG: DUF72 domain-containing protein [Pseudomonadota bacterium]